MTGSGGPETGPAYVCPTCRKPTPTGSRWRPFCTERCKMVDLGGWFLGKYRIAAVDDDDEDAAKAPLPDDPD
jgi:endogenous inhibitor of DNA gyrase (YacG/DUF329 family)